MNYKILVAPLDWGLGHATRCIPVIRALLEQKCSVVLAGEGPSLQLLKEEFPELPSVVLKGYRIRLPKGSLLALYFMMRLPSLVSRVIHEHQQLKSIIREQDINMVISDNRYGLWNRTVHSVLITHQLNIIPPPALRFTAPVLRAMTRFFASRFDECWVPDNPEEPSLSGELSHGHSLPANLSYIGYLSRFDINAQNPTTESQPSPLPAILAQPFDVVVLVSGPEPQRSSFEALMISRFYESAYRTLIVRGLPGMENSADPIKHNGNITMVEHLDAASLYGVMKQGCVVVCRGGYSTLMDLAYTGNKVICIPTPGQTEQEYLARRGAAANMMVYETGDNFNADHSVIRAALTRGIERPAMPLFNRVLMAALKKVKRQY